MSRLVKGKKKLSTLWRSSVMAPTEPDMSKSKSRPEAKQSSTTVSSPSSTKAGVVAGADPGDDHDRKLVASSVPPQHLVAAAANDDSGPQNPYPPTIASTIPSEEISSTKDLAAAAPPTAQSTNRRRRPQPERADSSRSATAEADFQQEHPPERLHVRKNSHVSFEGSVVDLPGLDPPPIRRHSRSHSFTLPTSTLDEAISPSQSTPHLTAATTTSTTGLHPSTSTAYTPLSSSPSSSSVSSFDHELASSRRVERRSSEGGSTTQQRTVSSAAGSSPHLSPTIASTKRDSGLITPETTGRPPLIITTSSSPPNRSSATTDQKTSLPSPSLLSPIADPANPVDAGTPSSTLHSHPTMNAFPPASPGTGTRKIWVKRPGASATLVAVAEDSVVDELRDHVLRKYSNSLGRNFDSPDLGIKIVSRENASRQIAGERLLSPEEPLVPLMETYYPGGQTFEEALIVDIPARRTPKPSPRFYHSGVGEDDSYFPLMPVNVNLGTPPAHAQSTMSSNSGVSTHPAPAISVLTTGKVPALPSPGGRTNRSGRPRPPIVRHKTNSPTLVSSAATVKDAPKSVNGQGPPSAPSLPTPPAPAAPSDSGAQTVVSPTRVSSPRPRQSIKKGPTSPGGGATFGGLIEGTVPPINVLIVEDNVINQKLLEAFMKRLRVRWQCAPNGEVAVKKWREGGFHLVLMDIQLPVMNGLDATKEIRRLERLNGIGVFSKNGTPRANTPSMNGRVRGEGAHDTDTPLKEEDVLSDLSLFKSPVIIVALTASSLQSDRHEALAAGCNDFLTKPVRFPWLEQKVTEWGCMQALIDFEGWRKWRGYEDSPGARSPAKSQASRSPQPNGIAMVSAPQVPAEVAGT